VAHVSSLGGKGAAPGVFNALHQLRVVSHLSKVVDGRNPIPHGVSILHEEAVSGTTDSLDGSVSGQQRAGKIRAKVVN
jgi:hypothetical protein